jgi:hypothetical protein
MKFLRTQKGKETRHKRKAEDRRNTTKWKTRIGRSLYQIQVTVGGRKISVSNTSNLNGLAMLVGDELQLELAS